jgi:DNA-binding NtrC family response regulator
MTERLTMNTKESKASILIIENTPESLCTLTQHLHKAGIEVTIALSGEQALELIKQAVPEIILLNTRLPGIDGFETCRCLKQHQVIQTVPILLMTGERIDKKKCLTVGALGYITKPFQHEEVLMQLNSHLNLFRHHKMLKQQNDQLKEEIKHLKSTQKTLLSIAETKRPYHVKQKLQEIPIFIGKSQSIMNIRNEIHRLQNVDKTNILIEGECGTGKELIARAIHEGGSRAKGPFIPVNCSAIPHDLAESQLFGVRRGAFTGALENRKGYFELAEGGTLFLDEIGEMPILLQAKLLRALEEKMIMAVGAEKFKPINIRVIAATNANLLANIEAGQFRRDLYFRLAGFQMTAPPLRTHQEDIALLADHFLAKLACDMGNTKKRLTEEALQALESYDYPGNVRELKNILERALICSDGETIESKHLSFLSCYTKTQSAFCFQKSAMEYDLVGMSDEDKILAFVEKKGSINNSRCQQLLRTNHSRAAYLLGKMNRSGLLLREGTNRATIYRLPVINPSPFPHFNNIGPFTHSNIH